MRNGPTGKDTNDGVERYYVYSISRLHKRNGPAMSLIHPNGRPHGGMMEKASFSFNGCQYWTNR